MVGPCVGMSAPVNVFVSKELNRLDILSGEISVYSVKGNLVLYRTVDNHLYIGTLGLSSRVRGLKQEQVTLAELRAIIP